MTQQILKSTKIKLLLAGITLALGGCASSPTPQIGMASSQASSALGQDGYTIKRPTSYELRPNDVISINVYREPELSLQKVAIGPESAISLPMIGSVSTYGKTASQLANDITKKLDSAGLKAPLVAVNVTQYGSHMVTVEGSVKESGVYPFTPGARLSSAIAMAKGPDRVANLKEVAVFRERADGISVALFDFRAIREGTMMDPVIEPGDRVVVGLSGLSQAWQDLLRALPAFALFTNVNI